MWTLETSNGKEIALARLPAMVGSASDADITLAHPSIEAVHAALSESESGQLQVAAIGDAVIGIAGKRVERGVVAMGQVLVIGKVAFTVGKRGAARAEPELVQRRRPVTSTPPARPATERATAGAGKRGTALQFSKQGKRTGLIHTDLSQLDAVGKIVVTLVLLAIVGAFGWALSLGVEALM